MKRWIPIVLIVALLLCSAVSAADMSPDFEDGMISGIAADGDAYFALDTYNKVIWRVDDSGPHIYAGDRQYTDVRGIVIANYFDGKLEEARFMEPWGISPFLEGWAVTDSKANAVRYFDDETVETAAGSGESGLVDGFCLDAVFSHPTGLATDDNGCLFIADTGNGAIRFLNDKGDVGTVLTGLNDPTGLCWHDGALYIAETGRSRILRYADGKLTVLAGDGGQPDDQGVYGSGFADGPAKSALFEHPQGVIVAEDGTVYIADTGNAAIRCLKDGRVSTLARASDDLPQLASPRGLMLRGNTLVVSDALTGGILEFSTQPKTFADVKADDWFAPAVKEALARGIISGDGDGFDPQAPMTRADFVTMLARLQQSLDGTTVIDGSFSFTDVTDDTPYAAVARWSGDFGIITGTDTGAFMGDEPIQRQQLVTILHRFVTISGLDTSGTADLGDFTDGASTAAYAREPMAWAVSRNIVNGFPDGSLAPAAGATRAQAVKILIYYMDMYGF